MEKLPSSRSGSKKGKIKPASRPINDDSQEGDNTFNEFIKSHSKSMDKVFIMNQLQEFIREKELSKRKKTLHITS